MSALIRLRSLIARHSLITEAAGRFSRSGLALGLGSGCIVVSGAQKEEEFPADHGRTYGLPGTSRDPSFLWRRACNPNISISLLKTVPSVNEGEDGANVPVSERIRNISKRVRRVGVGILDDIEGRWQTDNGRVVLQLIGANVAVFALWKVLPSSVMLRHFSSSLEAMRRGRVWTTITANFSQYVSSFSIHVRIPASSRYVVG
jgi:hypothetical protein